MAEIPGTDKKVVEVLGRELVAEHIGWHVEALDSADGERTHMVGVLRTISHGKNADGDIVTIVRLALSENSHVDVPVAWPEKVAIGVDAQSLLRYAVESMSDS